MFFVLLADYTFFMAGSFTFFFIAIGSIEPRDYRVVFLYKKPPRGFTLPFGGILFASTRPECFGEEGILTLFCRKNRL